MFRELSGFGRRGEELLVVPRIWCRNCPKMNSKKREQFSVVKVL